MSDREGNRRHGSRWLSPAAMEHDFNVDYRGDHVHVQIGRHYRVNPELRDKFWGRIAEVCRRHGSRRVLVEGFVPEGQRDTAEVVDAGLHTAAVPQLWMAFHLEGFKPNEQSELFETIAASRGVRVKFFPDTDRALKWLRTNTPQ